MGSLKAMGCLIFVFLVMALVFAGIGFVVHFLWILAAVFFVCWLAGFAFARGGRRGSRGRY
jgi:hypothetical protein